MRLRLLLITALSSAALTMVVLAADAPSQKTALVRFMKPTLIAGAAVMGPVVFEHDDARMARGEPCTTVYAYDTKRKRPGNVLVEFMCLPQERPLAREFAATCTRESPSGPDRLVEYQFAGNGEGHGVPFRPDRAH